MDGPEMVWSSRSRMQRLVGATGNPRANDDDWSMTLNRMDQHQVHIDESTVERDAVGMAHSSFGDEDGDTEGDRSSAADACTNSAEFGGSNDPSESIPTSAKFRCSA